MKPARAKPSPSPRHKAAQPARATLAPRPRILSGVPPAAAALAVAHLLAETGAKVALLVAARLERAETTAEETPFFATVGDWKIQPRARALPPPVLGGGADREDRPAKLAAGDRAAIESASAFEARCDLLAALASLRHGADDPAAPLLLACSPGALLQPCPPPEALQGREIVIRPGEPLPLRALVETLVEFGYDHESVCESPGQFAVRGGLVDVYPLNATSPARIDFFGDEVEVIRAFDPATQRSDAPLPTLIITASVAEDAANARPGAFLEHLPPDGALWIILEPDSFDKRDAAALLALIRPGDALALVAEFDEAGAFANAADANATANIHHWDGRDLDSLFAPDLEDQLGVDRLSAEENARERLLLELANRQHAGAAVKILAETAGGAARMRTLVATAKERWLTTASTGKTQVAAAASSSTAAAAPLSSNQVLCFPFTEREGPTPQPPPGSHLHRQAEVARAFAPAILIGTPSAGFVLEKSCLPTPLVVATEHEFFGRRRRRVAAIRQRRLPRKSRVEQLLDFNELVDGDPLVHLQHGICLYRGINTINAEEMISLEFDAKVTTHLPLREAHLLSRYVGLRKAAPKLGKIGSGAWVKTRRAAEAATVDFAAELLSLHARRHSRPGIAFPPDADQPWLHEFEQSFPYRETPDQARAIEDAKRDMEKPAPMDRLVCGDVGFGKTEVALRAAFKAVLAGHQAAILAPTTVLAQQHFNTFRERFAKYPISVEMLSRFRKPAARTRIIGQINSGQLDIVIGTHALLSPAVNFPRLGLLVIDEEHRFGVKQKEVIKRLRADVDVLCMSATPIPRTLYLALQGARELSIIETAPRERLPIRTLVRAYDLKLVEEAIRYEVGRGGQVFYLHNRVETIESVAARLRELMPEIRFGIGHGKMAETDLEDVMTAFVAGAFDVLVCTTIIETGLDIPNCNTLIIEGADRFGLAQLYQLRGRVGRFNRQAYAYLLLHKHAGLLDPARKRLSAIRQHNQLGAGLRIAMRDLELRGTGNLLGREQSGHIAGVGFDLYCQLLRQSISRLKGDPTAAALRCEVRLDFVRHHSAAAFDWERSASAQERSASDRERSASELERSGSECSTDKTVSVPVAASAATSITPPAASPTQTGLSVLHSEAPPRAASAARPSTSSTTSTKSTSSTHSPRPPAASTISTDHGFQVLKDADLATARVSEITATLPATYISDTRLRIDLFRRLALAPAPEAVREIAADIADRFGPLPPEALACVELAEIRTLAEARGIVSIETEGPRLKCRRAVPAPDGSLYLKVGVNFPHLTQRNPQKRLRELKTYLSRLPAPAPAS
jgi:transcription-repair coupling factor (superfamily II helicase)